MKNKNILKISLLLTLFALIGCSKDAPTPTNEQEDKGHDEWSKVVFTIRKGHLHPPLFHADKVVEGNPLAEIQQFSFELNGQNVVRKNKNGKILQAGEEPIVMIEGRNYAMEIVYYNAKGERINKEFTTQQMLPIHQHFFTFNKYINTQDGKEYMDTSGVLDYVYRDTDPEDVQVGKYVNPDESTKISTVTGDALGLKGYFTPKISYVKFDMQVRLLHILKGSKYINNKKEEGTYPFNAPALELLSRSDTDFSQIIPVQIITKISNGEKDDFERYVNDLATYYKKSPDDIKKYIEEASSGADNSPYYM